jgi:hypothetical protein
MNRLIINIATFIAVFGVWKLNLNKFRLFQFQDFLALFQQIIAIHARVAQILLTIQEMLHVQPEVVHAIYLDSKIILI